MKVMIRADGGTAIGTGHIFRTLVLARRLRAEGHDVFYVCRPTEGLPTKRIFEGGFRIEEIPVFASFAQEPDILQAIVSKESPDWVIVDHYDVKEPSYQRLRKGRKVLAIDDINHTRFDVDVLLNQNVNAGDLNYNCPWSTKKLLGPQYALVSEVYSLTRAEAQVRKSLQNVLVFMGGSDAKNYTLKILRSLLRCQKKFHVHVVVGSAYRHLNELHECLGKTKLAWRIHQDLPNLAKVILFSDLAVGAGGSATWEMATLKLPMVLMPVADNQMGIAQGMAKTGAALFPGRAEDVSEDRLAGIIDGMKDKDIERMSKKSGAVCDGLGVDRVAKFIR